MDPSSLSNKANGLPVRCGHGDAAYWAFMPNPLPPKMIWTDELVSMMEKATLAIGRLAGTGQLLTNPHLLIMPFLRREAVLSSRIEGTQASLSELVLFEIEPATEQKIPDVREVANYVRALEYGLKRLEDLPLSLRLIREIHEHLMDGVRGQESRPGEFRNSQNWIGTPGDDISNATYVPPPPEKMHEALNDFEKYLHQQGTLPSLVRLAAIHYQFEAIHPFLDGNGRVGRLLMVLLLCVDDILPQPLLYLSAYFNKHREQYYHHLHAVSEKGRWSDWIRFFLLGVIDQATDAVHRADKLLSIREQYRKKCHDMGQSGLPHRAVDELFLSPAVTVKLLAQTLDISWAWANELVHKLENAGILREITGKSRNRIYVAESIVNALEDPKE